jgi:hypothetical protein
MTVGGSIESVSIKGRIFAVASDAECTRKLGGFENEIQVNGNGTTRTVKTRVAWALDGLSIVMDDDRGDQEFLQEVANGKEDVPIAITFASNVTYQAQGTITGEVPASSQNATGAISLGGPGELSKQ